MAVLPMAHPSLFDGAIDQPLASRPWNTPRRNDRMDPVPSGSGRPRALNGFSRGSPWREKDIAARYGRINGADPAPEPGCRRPIEAQIPPNRHLGVPSQRRHPRLGSPPVSPGQRSADLLLVVLLDLLTRFFGARRRLGPWHATSSTSSKACEFDRGYLSPYFITDAEKMVAELDGSSTSSSTRRSYRPCQSAPANHRRQSSKAAKPLLIIAEDIEGEGARDAGHKQAAQKTSK